MSLLKILITDTCNTIKESQRCVLSERNQNQNNAHFLSQEGVNLTCDDRNHSSYYGR